MPEKETREDNGAKRGRRPDESRKDQKGDEDLSGEKLVTAKDLPQPSTALDTPRRSSLENVKVSLAAELPPISPLAEVEEINARQDYDSRTPLTTVILCVLEEAGGSMSLSDLAQKAARLWNRPFPASPYSKEEFIYLVVRNSDYILIEEN